MEETRDPPVHFYDHDASGRLTRIACGVATTRYTTDPLKCSCRKCSREAQGMTDDQREEAWQNANERLESEATSPWVKAQKKKERAEAKKARAAERAAKAAKKKQAISAGGHPF